MTTINVSARSSNSKQPFIIILGIIVAIVIWTSIFTVDQREKAIKFKFGEIMHSEYAPGLHMRIPFIHNIRKYDARIQTLDSDPEQYLTSEKKNVVVDSFLKWRIVDASTFYTAMGGNLKRADMRLSQIVKDQLRGEFGKRTIAEVVSGERNQVMLKVRESTDIEAKNFGIEIIDVRLKRVDLTREVSNSVYLRMEAERQRVAKELRSEGAEKAEFIQAEADKDRTVILAEAYRDAEKIRGVGDAKATETYATAFNTDAEFYSFYRSLNAYRTSFNSKNDILLIDPKTDFFKYFEHSRVR